MLEVKNMTLRFGKRTLYEDVNLKFTEGNCYGIIGANGSGKSTFLKVLTKEIDTTSGEIFVGKNETIAILEQDHFKYEEERLIDVVIRGNERLYNIMKEKEKLYSKETFTEEDGMKLGELEADFLELNGWEAESEASILLSFLGVDISLHYNLMKDVLDSVKVKVLLAKALFRNPDILLLDEPTNNLDYNAIKWLEEFLINYKNTTIVVSHDRHFLNSVCTHIVDIDYSKMKLYSGNYDFWYKSSQLALKQMQEQNKKKEEKIKELQDFIARFSANASKSKQATSRKKILEKIELEEIIPSSRKYPYINFNPEKLSGNEILTVKNLTKELDGKKVLNNVSFIIQKHDKVAILGNDDLVKTLLLEILMGKEKNYKGQVIFGKTINKSYIPKDNSEYFETDSSLIEWLSTYYENADETEVRNFLGRMLFSKEEVFKKVNVLSGGEKIRCLLAKCMLENPNMLILDEPTNHLDLESITSLNNELTRCEIELIFTTKDQELLETVANRIIEIKDDGTIIDRKTDYKNYMENKNTAK